MLVKVTILNTACFSSGGVPYSEVGMIDVDAIESIRKTSFRGYPCASRLRMKSGDYLFAAESPEQLAARISPKPTADDDERRRADQMARVKAALAAFEEDDDE